MFVDHGKLLLLVVLVLFAQGGKIKIIDEPFSLNANDALDGHQRQQEIKILSKVDPQPVSGPSHLRRLAGRCFHLTKGSFKYDFCPFKNLTQMEQSYRWNAFHGVLGVWKEWIIANNTFIAMKMDSGERCIADMLREAKVLLKCGESEELSDVIEPTTCKYEATFKTPLACPTDSFLVYPSLSHDGRKAWDELQAAWYNDEVTQQGYDKRLKDIFVREGLQVSPKAKHLIRHEAQVSNRGHDEPRSDTSTGKFSTLSQCSQEYEKLFKELQNVKVLANASDVLDKNPNSREAIAAKIISAIANNSHR